MKKTFRKSVQDLLSVRAGRLVNLAGVFLVAGTLSLSASTYATEHMLSLNLKNATIREAIESIKSQSEFSFSLDVKDLNLDEKVSVSLDNKTINEVLAVLFNGRNVRYEINDRHVVITRAGQVGSNAVMQQVKQITGRVLDANNEPIIGANVVVEGTTIGTVTDADGNFALDVPDGATLKISYIGYIEQSISVGNKSVISVILKEDSQALDEVVVVGFGTQKKLNLTGAVTAVTGEEMTKRPVTNAATMLQGQVPGLRVNQGLGAPGAEATTFRVRGQGTFSDAGSDPLVLVNGVPGSISNLDPSMIESVSVLKDAASAAIYGARAANGVILVTTKQGAEGDGKAHIAYHGNVAIYNPTRMYDLVTNSAEYMELYNLAKANSGAGERYTQEQINAYRNGGGSVQYPNFDWLDYMFNPAVVQNHNLSIAGNAGRTTYNVALNFVDQPGTLKGFDYQKYNATVDLTSQITDFIKIGTYTNLMYGDRDEPRQGQSDVLLSTMSQAPTYMPWLPDDGSGVTRWTNSAYSFESHNKNMPAIIGTGTNKNYQDFDINAQLWLDIKLAKGLSWYTKGAVRLQSNKWKEWGGSDVPIYDYHTGEQTGYLDRGANGLTVEDQRRFYTNLYTYLKYDFTTPNLYHNFNIMAGYSQESEKYETVRAFRKEYAFDLPVIDAGSNANWSNEGKLEEWAIQSVFARLNYNFKERYLFEANMRYDGTSRISSENRWGIFPSFSAGWRISQEEFMKNISWINNLKIRASWGTLGNINNVGNYDYFQNYNLGSDYNFNDEAVKGILESKPANLGLGWETVALTDFGVDIDLFDNKLSIVADYYIKNTSDILLGYNVPVETGIWSAPSQNIGKVKNTGFEMALTYRGNVGDLKYTVTGNIATNKNKVVDLAGSDDIISNGGDKIRFILREGEPIGSFYGYKTDGLYTQEEIDAGRFYTFGRIPNAGDIKYVPQREDVKYYGDLEANEDKSHAAISGEDRTIIGKDVPDFTYGVNLNLQWKNFELSVFGQGVSGTMTAFESEQISAFMLNANPREFHRGRWTQENPNPRAIYPRIYGGHSLDDYNQYFSDYQLFDSDYFRIKSISLGYMVPINVVKSWGLSSLKLFVTGENLFTLRADDKMKDFDPESPSGRGLSYLGSKSVAFGVNVSF